MGFVDVEVLTMEYIPGIINKRIKCSSVSSPGQDCKYSSKRRLCTGKGMPHARCPNGSHSGIAASSLLSRERSCLVSVSRLHDVANMGKQNLGRDTSFFVRS